MQRASRTVSFQIASAIEGTDYMPRLESYLHDVPGHIQYAGQLRDFMDMVGKVTMDEAGAETIESVLRGFPICKMNLRESLWQELESDLLRVIASMSKSALKDAAPGSALQKRMVEVLAEATIIWPLKGHLSELQSDMARAMREGSLEKSLSLCKEACQHINEFKEGTEEDFVVHLRELGAMQPQPGWREAIEAKGKDVIEKCLSTVMQRLAAALASKTTKVGEEPLKLYTSTVELLSSTLGDDKGCLSGVVASGVQLYEARTHRMDASVSTQTDYRQLLSCEKTAHVKLLEAVKSASESKLLKSFGAEIWKRAAGASKTDIIQTLEKLKRMGAADVDEKSRALEVALQPVRSWDKEGLQSWDAVMADATKTLLSVDTAVLKSQAESLEQVSCGARGQRIAESLETVQWVYSAPPRSGKKRVDVQGGGETEKQIQGTLCLLPKNPPCMAPPKCQRGCAPIVLPNLQCHSAQLVQVFKAYEGIFGIEGKDVDGNTKTVVMALLQETAVSRIVGKFMTESGGETSGGKLREHACKLVKDLRRACPQQDKPEKAILGPVLSKKVDAILAMK